jgi:hypothetical protein
MCVQLTLCLLSMYLIVTEGYRHMLPGFVCVQEIGHGSRKEDARAYMVPSQKLLKIAPWAYICTAADMQKLTKERVCMLNFENKRNFQLVCGRGVKNLPRGRSSMGRALHIIHHLTQRQPIRQLRRAAIPLVHWLSIESSLVAI